MHHILLINMAFIVDIFLGDPFSFHPVRAIGWLVCKFEQLFRKTLKDEVFGGCMLVLLVIMISGGLTFFIIFLCRMLHPQIGLIAEVWLMYTTLAIKDLNSKTMVVYDALNKNDMPLARRLLGFVVGRDTQNLNETEVIRGTIETISENFVDGILAPLIFCFIGGAPLGIIYKAINTMDSMIGYKNEKYLHFGMCAAKLDDLVNLIPARLSTIFISVASYLTGNNLANSLRIAARDGRNHCSPNSGIPEAAIAGALNIRLGGPSTYQGRYVEKPFIGNDFRKLEINDIRIANRIIFIASVLSILSGNFVGFFFHFSSKIH